MTTNGTTDNSKRDAGEAGLAPTARILPNLPEDDPSIIPHATTPLTFPTRQNYEFDCGDYILTTDPAFIDYQVVVDFLINESYWGNKRTPEIIRRSIQHSICFSLLRKQATGQRGAFCGFTRLTTDYATFAYICDLFVLRGERGKGLGKWMVKCVMRHPEVAEVNKWFLRTEDAHGLYERFGFKRDPLSFMYLVKEPIV
ncbi:uncharacterized protein VTP21DRAFT_5147 [Calcarisporiella thermophila]|uniref:uncharacterized protein n=1 Tax=Calcarisporiella thermophila TaxID=911321 RepID=UPI00374212EE